MGAGAGATYRYFRWTFSAGHDSNKIKIAEMNLLVNSTVYPTSAMTDHNAPSPLVVTQDSEIQYGGGWWVFGNDGGENRWMSDNGFPHWLKLDLGDGNGINPTSYNIQASGSVSGLSLIHISEPTRPY